MGFLLAAGVIFHTACVVCLVMRVFKVMQLQYLLQCQLFLLIGYTYCQFPRVAITCATGSYKGKEFKPIWKKGIKICPSITIEISVVMITMIVS